MCSRSIDDKRVMYAYETENNNNIMLIMIAMNGWQDGVIQSVFPPNVLSPVASSHEDMDTSSNTSCPTTPIMVSLHACIVCQTVNIFHLQTS